MNKWSLTLHLLGHLVKEPEIMELVNKGISLVYGPVLRLNFILLRKNSMIIEFNQNPPQCGLKALNEARNNQEHRNNLFSNKLYLCKWYPGWGQWAEALCLVARQQGICYSVAHQYQHEALTKPHSWFHLCDGYMELLGNRKRLCNAEKVRVGIV